VSWGKVRDKWCEYLRQAGVEGADTATIPSIGALRSKYNEMQKTGWQPTATIPSNGVVQQNPMTTLVAIPIPIPSNGVVQQNPITTLFEQAGPAPTALVVPAGEQTFNDEVHRFEKLIESNHQQVLNSMSEKVAELKACLHRLEGQMGGEKSVAMAAVTQQRQFCIFGMLCFPNLTSGCADFQAPALAVSLLKMSLAGMCTPDRYVGSTWDCCI
jgi:hypothetical protein